VLKAGDTMTGDLDMSGTQTVTDLAAPSADSDAATKLYVDTSAVSVSGDTMTGSLALPVDGLAVGTGQFVVSGGSVGVGTTTPSALFEVATYAASGVLDQECADGNNGKYGANSWQSFTAGISGHLTTVSLQMRASSAPTLSLYAGEGLGGTLLYSASVSLSNGWNAISIASPFEVTGGQQYTIALSNAVNWEIYLANAYPGGSLEGSSVDACFRTYVAAREGGLSVTQSGIQLAPLDAAPAAPSEGDTYYDTSLHKLRCWDGTTWQDMW
jgi:hypothetical protein